MTDNTFHISALGHEIADALAASSEGADTVLTRSFADLTKITFSFYEVNPGIGSFGFAAQSAGGIPHGGELVSDIARESYRSWFGHDSINAPNTPIQVVLANLPFSPFVDLQSPDPEVRDIVLSVAVRAKKAKLVLFRVDWTIGKRLQLSCDGYLKLISANLKGYDVKSLIVRNLDYVNMGGEELFIVAAKSWRTEFEIIGDPTYFHAVSGNQNTVILGSPADRFDSHYYHEYRTHERNRENSRLLNPSEILEIIGLPSDFPLPSERNHAYQVACSSVAVPAAAHIILSAISAAKLD